VRRRGARAEEVRPLVRVEERVAPEERRVDAVGGRDMRRPVQLRTPCDVTAPAALTGLTASATVATPGAAASASTRSRAT
jgi:hypothetical protein